MKISGINARLNSGTKLPDIAAGDPLPKEFVWMPIGTSGISAGTADGKGFTGKIICDEQACRVVQAELTKRLAAGQRACVDLNHFDAEASGDIRSFSWDPARGIVAHVDWTPRGESALRNKEYSSFSPAFLAEGKTGRVVGLIAGKALGGLVNFPAFLEMPSLIAARQGGANPDQPDSDGNSETRNMKELLIKILAALKVTPPADATEETLVSLVAKSMPADPSAEIAALKAKLDASVQAAADTATAAAVQAKADAAALKAKSDAAATEITELKAKVAAIDAGSSGRAGHGIVLKANPFDAIKAMMKETDHRKRGQIYCSDLREFVAGTAHLAEVLASNAFGSLTGDLIVLRALDLLKLNFPVLSRITTDFSSEVSRQGQAIKTRIISVPSVVTYNDTTGWASSDATATDVTVTIGQPVGVQIALTSTDVANTNRDLFAEQVEASQYALGKNMVDALYALITQANFGQAGAGRTIKALASMARGTVIDMGTALGKRGAGLDRTLLLNSDYFGALSKDYVTISNASLVDKSVQEQRSLPKLHNFTVVEASNLPAAAFTSTTGTLQGFGFTKDALVMAARVPEDYSRALPGAAHGNISVVTNPDTGISVQKTDFVDHILGRAYSRIALSYGVAKGQVASGQCLTET